MSAPATRPALRRAPEKQQIWVKPQLRTDGSLSTILAAAEQIVKDTARGEILAGAAAQTGDRALPAGLTGLEILAIIARLGSILLQQPWKGTLETVALLKRLSEASGVSGYEDQVRDIVRDEFGRCADQVTVDVLGNVVALKRGTALEPRPAVMLAAHMDEIGLIVADLEEGFIHFQQVGGYDDRVLLGQEVIVHGRQDLRGVIGARPPHLLPASERNRPIPYEKLLVDVGRTPDELGRLVRVGDLITMNRQLVELQGDLVAGKALDNRSSVAAMVVCLEQLTRIRHEWDVYAVATVQEEVGLKGAVTSAYGLEPDLGIVVDVTFAKQPGTPDDHTFELGRGPTIACGPNFHPKLQEALVETAKELEIPYHLEPDTNGGTDAWAIQISRQGIPAGLIAIPQRNMHTPVETVSVTDIERAGRLLAAFVGRLDGKFLSSLNWSLFDDD